MNQDNPRSLALFRLLALAHGLIGLGPLLFNLLLGGLMVGRIQLMPVTGVSIGWLLALTIQWLIPVAFGAWMLVLAVRLWRPTLALAGQLRRTHWLVLLFGGLHCVWGVYAVRAAERSTAAGGGLMGPVAVGPFLIGIPLVALAVTSLFAAGRIARLR